MDIRNGANALLEHVSCGALVEDRAPHYSPRMPDVLSLKTRLSTPLLAETRAWYCELLGLEVVEEWNDPGDRGCILALPGGSAQAYLEIHHADAPVDFAGLSLQFRVEDVAGFAVPDDPRFVHRGPVARPWGSQYLFFTDPNGVSVALFSGTSL